MRYLTTLLLAALSLNVFSQNNSIHVYPWNPDANHNNSIGTDDLLPFLSVFGEEFGLPPEPCTYDGTDFEDLMFGILDGTIILDSLFLEYEIEDITTYYPIGCPDQVTDTLIFNNAVMLTDLYTGLINWNISAYDNYGGANTFGMVYEPQLGTYNINLGSNILGALGFINDGFFGFYISESPNSSIPFPADWYLDEDGIHILSGWDDGDWVYYANYLHILPYWHYADE